MKAVVLLSLLFSCPSPPTVCLGAIDASQYVPLSALVPFEETTNAAAFFKDVPSLTVYLCLGLQCLVIYGPTYRRCLSAALVDAKKNLKKKT